ncbi:MAG: hypothetical protein J5379_05575 [Clostridiales bacterium]|nr:hypothetical protein [Clostridiales bacterium]
MEKWTLKIVFALFAASLSVAAIAFNLEKMILAILFFALALVFGAIMVGLNKRVSGEEKSQKK